MNKVLSVSQAAKESKKLRKENKTVVVVGGCFDILHIGHLRFFEKAKSTGDVLFVLLESDETICNNKGENRPINTQKHRAKLLSALSIVDAVVLLPLLVNDKDYDDVISLLKPDIIATTKLDPYRIHKERQAKLTGAKVLDVIGPISDQSTTRITKLLEEI